MSYHILSHVGFLEKLNLIPKDLWLIVAKYAKPWYGDTAFLFGGYEGYDETGAVSSSFRFNIKENKWITLNNVIPSRAFASATLHSDMSSIFICGGQDEKRNCLSSVIRYSILNDTWNCDVLPSMIRARILHSSVEYNGSIFVIGGKNYHGLILASCEIFNIVGNSWEFLPDMHQARSEHSSVFHDGYVYALGGYNQYRYESKKCERYNISSQMWNSIADMHRGECGHKSVVLSMAHNRIDNAYNVNSANSAALILTIGGFNSKAVQQYSVNDKEWSIVKWELPMQHSYSSIHMINDNDNTNSLLLCGGWASGESQSSCWRIWLTNTGDCVKIAEIPKLLVPLCGMAFC